LTLFTVATEDPAESGRIRQEELKYGGICVVEAADLPDLAGSGENT
jgi:hypothetical protein